MVERYCPECRTEVEDVGGFCLLGHDLRLRAMTESTLGDLRAEVDRAFEQARVQVAAITGEVPTVPGNPPPPPPPPPLPDDLEEQTKTHMQELWAGFEEEPQTPWDPITQFAPSTRMDWGPGEKSKRRGFRRS